VSDRRFLSGYVFIFTTFFAFSATLNVLPFRLVEIQTDISSARISLVYSGYILGIFIATFNQKLVQLAAGRIRAMAVSLTVLLAGLLLLLPANVWWLVLISFVTAGGMFFIHSTLAGYMTSLMPEQSNLINGLYISVYYAAGAVGSLLPLWVYHESGWLICVLFIFTVALSGFYSLNQLKVKSSLHEK